MGEEAGRKFAGVTRTPGVAASHMWALLFAAFVSIGIVTAMAVLTPYLLSVNLKTPIEAQGRALGALNFVNEVTLILVYGAVGALADKVGRRAIYVAGFVAMAAGYVLYPMADTLAELSLFRVIYAIGIGAATGMLSTIIADYAVSSDRGKLVAICGVLNGLGVVVAALVIGRLPAIFAENGALPREAGLYAFWVAGAICLVSGAILWFTLKPGAPTALERKPPYLELARRGFAAARNPRIALAYASAFVARGDLAIVGSYAVAWGKLAALDAGFDAATALDKGRIPFIIAQSAALLWPIVVILLIDRLHRTTALALSMAIAAIGYCAMHFVGDPLSGQAIPLFVLLGIGQISAFLGAQSIISKEAPEAERGAVIGTFSFFGALGILVLATAGGWLFDAVSPQATFVMIGVLNGLIALIALLVRFADKTALSDR
jgi:MFS family permease